MRSFPLSEEEEKATTLEEAKFVFSQAEKLLKETTTEGDLIISRTTNLITLISASLLGLFGFLANKIINASDLNFKDLFDPINLTAIVAFSYVLYIAYCLYLNLKPTEYYGLGTKPEDLMRESYYHDFYLYDKSAREKAYHLTEIASYNNRIGENILVNSIRWRRINKTYILIIIAPFILFGFYFIYLSIYQKMHCLTYP